MFKNITPIIYTLILGGVLFASCSPEKIEVASIQDNNKIIFIGQSDISDTEFVVRTMLRGSILEDEYTILRPNDTIEFSTQGRFFFMVGERNTVLDSLIVDKGNVVLVRLNNDSLVIEIEGDDITDNLSWFNRFHHKVEDDYQEIFKPTTPADFLKMPMSFTNDFAIEVIRYTHPYMVDIERYNRNKESFDIQIKNKYFEQDSLIRISDLDSDSKMLLSNALFNSTIDVFRRLGDIRQSWMYDHIKSEFIQDCNFNYTTSMSDYFMNYETGKRVNRVTILDLEKVFRNREEFCPDFQQEIQRLCLLRMFRDRNRTARVRELFNEYVNLYNDTVFYSFIEADYGLREYNVGRSSMKVDGIYVDIKEQESTLDQLLDDRKGDVVLLDFWASWCAPCRDGMPDVLELEQKYGDKGFKVIYASIDVYPNPWKRASKVEGIINSNYWVSNFAQSAEHEKYNVKSIPRYILFDKSGQVVYEDAPKSEAMEEIILDMLNR